ncbi:hypothetical protein PT2222_40286 [Paraburkholderia tropica]
MGDQVLASGLWMPIWYDAGREIDGMWCSCTHYGAAIAGQGEAWAEAHRMCEATNGIGFSVQRVEPVASKGATSQAPRTSRRIHNAYQSLRGER